LKKKIIISLLKEYLKMPMIPPTSPQPKMGAHATSENAGAENKGAPAESTCAAAKGGGGKKHPPLPGRASKAQRDAHAAAQAAALQREAELEQQAAQQKAAATAALKQRLEQEEKRDAAERREAAAALETARKASVAKEWEMEKAAEARRKPGKSACTGHGQIGCNCFYHTYIRLDPHERMAVALDNESHQETYGNTSRYAVLQAFERGGVAAARKHVAKNKK
jgi:hypothetical protein